MNQQNLTLQAQKSQISGEDLHADTAEQVVLYWLLIDGDSLIEKVKKALPEAVFFGHPLYRNVYKTMLDLYDAGIGINYLSVLDKSKDLKASSVADIVTNLPDPVDRAQTSSACLDDYLALVSRAHFKRQLYQKIINNERMDDILAEVEKMERKGSDKYFDPRDAAAQVLAAFEHQENTLAYPFDEIQRATGGIYKGQVVIVAARPATGKSTFLENIATEIAKSGKKVLFATAEMSTEMISLRILTRLTHQNMFYQRQLGVELQNRTKIDIGAAQLAETGLHILEFTAIPQLEETIRERGRDMELVVVDYLQLLEPRARYRSIYEKVTAIANELTHLAKKYHLPMLVACQYNRLAEKNIPTMADLKESGQIEQNADVIISLWNNKDSDALNVERTRIRVDILKNRNGYTFQNDKNDPKHYLLFNKPNFEFSNPGMQFSQLQHKSNY